MLLADCISGVGIGEKRRNVLGGRQLLAHREYLGTCILCQGYFCTFFNFAPSLLPLYALLSLSFRPASLLSLLFFHESLCASPNTAYILWSLFFSFFSFRSYLRVFSCVVSRELRVTSFTLWPRLVRMPTS